jgi:hypothetical protein
MHFDSAMASGHVAGSDFAFAGQVCEASFTHLPGHHLWGPVRRFILRLACQ